MVYSSIDIGSDTIKIVVGKVIDDNINIVASTKTRSVGIKKGLIVDKEMACKSIMLALDEMEKKVGFKIDKALVNVPIYDVNVNVYNGECYTDGIITGNDIVNCFKGVVKMVDLDEEVVTVFPIDFIVDGEDKYLDPKGVNGYKLESRILVTTVPKNILYPYFEVLEKCHIEAIDLTIGPVADYYQSHLHDEFKKVSGALVNIGEDKTEVAIFNKGLMVKGEVLPIEGRMIDYDIKYIYHFDRQTARNLKEHFAVASSQYASNEEVYEYEGNDGETKMVNQLEISQIVEARLEEILKNVKKSLYNLTNREISYIIITGGVSNLPGFNYLLEDVFGDKAYTVNMNTIGVRDNSYTTAVGMIKYYVDKLKIRDISYDMYEDYNEKIENKKNLLRDGLIENIRDYMENN